MNKNFFKLLLPHIIAVLIFLIVAVLYCSPALQGKVLQQSDITMWEGSIQQSVKFAEVHGKYPLWTNSNFAGMPAFQIGYENNNWLPGIVHNILTLWLPKPIQFFFLASLCFYFLCVMIGVRPWIGILGGLAFAYATYNPIIITVGHETKMWTMAYMPALLGSIILVYEKRYWLGGALTALFASVMIAMNHPQIVYYLFIAIAIMTIFYIVRWIRNGEMKHLAISLGIALVAGLVGVASNAVNLMSTYEYQKETIRGGASELADTTTNHSTTGLDKNYAFAYSMSITEPFVMMIPQMYGGSSDHEEISQENSKAIEAASTLPQELQSQLPLTYYWGGVKSIDGAVGTSGPPYVGAIMCFLAIVAMFVLERKHKWWIFTAIVVTVMMSWGSYFDAFNSILYNALPLYNKFRAPSMILVIPQLLIPLLAVLGFEKIVRVENRKDLFPAFKKALIATGVVFVVLFMIYIGSDFLSDMDKQILKNISTSNNQQLAQYLDSFYDGLKADRKSLMLGDIGRSFGFILVAAAFLYFLIRNTIKPWIAIAGITLFAFIDLIIVDTTYLNKDMYQEKPDESLAGSRFQLTDADRSILADTSYYRVFNFSGNAFTEAITSYHYNSLGGYHAAKLRIYQDLIERQFSRQQPNLGVLNMLNTKYFIRRNNEGLTEGFQQNPAAAGPAWFVKNVVFVKDAHAEMAALDNFNPKDTAFVREQFRSLVTTPSHSDSAGSITLIRNVNDVINYTSNSSAPGFAVFSEIYYDKGWKAFIDGKEAPIVRTNYVLRGLVIPAGTHNIEFRFEPQGYIKGRSLTSIFTIILILILLGGVGMHFWRRKKFENLKI